MERRAYALALAYCGQAYSGWQRQPGERTVQVTVEAALARLGLDVRLSGAARTDAGVHARRQLATFRVRQVLPVDALLPALNALLPRSIRAIGLRPVGPSFHARASPHSREYHYRVQLGPGPGRLAWQLPDRSLPTVDFDPAATRRFLEGLLGAHDRTSFTSRPQRPKVTTLELATLEVRAGGRLRFRFRGDGFTRHLVRNWVWAAMARGVGVDATHEGPRGWRGPSAPGHGLILWDLRYADEPELFRT